MNLSTIRERILGRMEVDPADPLWQSAANAAIAEGQRLFAFLTLALETTREFVLTPGVRFYHMLDEGWEDWLLPLRVRLSNDTADGATAEWDAVEHDAAMFNEQGYSGLTPSAAPKLRPTSIYQMSARNDGWLNDTGTPSRYGVVGWDLLFLDKAPTQEGQKLIITYARNATTMVLDADVPDLPEADHAALISYGVARLRCNEGGQELANSRMLLKEFLDAAKLRADQVRSRSIANRLDRLPAEIEGYDYSRLLTTRPDLVPHRRQNRWTTAS